MSVTILQNGVYVPENDLYLISLPTDPDEQVTHTFKDGAVLTLSGGNTFAQRAGDFAKLAWSRRYEEWTLTSEDPFEVVAERFLILQPHRDPETGKAQPWRLRPIKEMDVKGLRKLAEPNVGERLGRADGALIAKVARHWLSVRADELVKTVRQLHSPDPS